MKTVHCYLGAGRAGACARSMAQGIKRCGHHVELKQGWSGQTNADAVVAYGWRNVAMFEAYRAKGKAFVYLDMGYWHRRPKGRGIYRGYHKVVVGDRDALQYFRRGQPASRWRSLAVDIKPWRRTGRHILLAGMSHKSAVHNGYRAQEWETEAVARIRRYSDRPILYRPKPSWPHSSPIAGTTFWRPDSPLQADLENAWAVVTHHSNVGLEALAAGIPVYSEGGLASTMTMELEQIESPPLPDDRESFFADVAYCQWSADEMESGACWRHLQREGLVP